MESKVKTCGPSSENGRWESWGLWSQCTADCGDAGRRKRKRVCSNPYPNACSRGCRGRDVETEPCGGLPPTHSMWSAWGSWSQCPVSCGQGTVSRSRICDTSMANRCGRQMCLGDDMESKVKTCGPSAENGRWEPWGLWSQCSSDCDAGRRKRRRVCSNPYPNACSRGCRGRDVESEPCGGIPPIDAQWTSWGVWSQCPVSCGQGTVSRERTCDTSMANRCGQQRCFGNDDRESKVITCGPTYEVAQWITWGAWGRCSQSCGIGQRERVRSCSNRFPNSCSEGCLGVDVEIGSCGTEVVDADWSNWGPWSTCPVSCGEGVITRTRRCDDFRLNRCGMECKGAREETKVIRCGPSTDHGVWDMWSSWSRCSSSCGGQRERRRRCSNLFPNACSRGCHGRDVITESCGADPMPSSWQSWGQWSTCHDTCGTQTVHRNRRCNSNPCGEGCRGDDRESKLQQCGPERVDAMWTQWAPWTTCHVTCGEGTVRRKRFCDESSMTSCGRTCQNGLDTDVKTVRCGPDPGVAVWESWTEWSDCRDTCGTETVHRSRRCNFSPCGGRCRGDDRESKVHRCGPEREVAEWESWGSWSRCSASCGQGVREKRRRCSNLFPNACSRPCRGRDVISEPCGNDEEPSTWQSWGQWSTCLDTCGTETVRRSRRCNLSSCGGSRCYGDDTESKVMRCGPDRDDGKWEMWGSWSRCSESCGHGTRERRRQCSNPFPTACSRPCRGREIDSEQCGRPTRNGQWTHWGQWTPFTATCGRGQRTRVRSCDCSLGDACCRPCAGPEVDVDENSRGNVPCYRFEYTEWAKWCPCDCTTGNTTRQRHCEQVNPDGRRERTHLANCHQFGNGREEEFCVNVPDVDECEMCITHCSDKHDGRYQSCTGCQDYVICKDRKISDVKRCRTGTFSAFDGKCSLNAKSCAVIPPLHSCRGEADGKYPSKEGPGYYSMCVNGKKLSPRRCTHADRFKYKLRNPTIKRQRSIELEYNHQLRACEMYHSPTYVRELKAAPRRTYDHSFLSDAPASVYTFEDDNLPENITDDKLAELKKFNAFIAIEEGETENKTRFIARRMNRDCITTCLEVEDGMYGSCRGCDTTAQCTDGYLRESRCPDKKEFDTKKRECVEKSDTCDLRGEEGWLP